MAITSVKIFPSIGIARLGNSPEFFVGYERPGDRTPPAGGYRDAHCRIKRQAARFRLFAFDGATLVGEITLAEADEISWTVHLANKKASWKKFDGLNGNAPLRNAGYMGPRADLEIDPGPRTLDGPNQAAGFNTGRFLNKVVALGEMRTEADGRLLVTGGFGSSGSVPAGEEIVHYANNDLWHDDVSDGPVAATVVIGGETFEASPAWVICGPPDFAPPLDSVTTLYDTLFQVAVDEGWLSVPAIPSFTQDIYPILQRIFDLARASNLAGSGHFDFDGSSAAAMSPARRQSILSRLRDPNNPGAAGPADMPRLFDDSNGFLLTVTKAQYEILKQWKDGNFTPDWPGSPPAPPANITPEGLTQAALEACVGAAFFPGIEASWFLRDTYTYLEPFRLDPAGRNAGDVTKQMAVPWQADFWKCQEAGGYAWWPAQRPDDVFPEGGGGPDLWTREIVFDHEDMIDHWHKLGFVVRKAGQLVETQRVKVCLSLTLVTDRSHFGKDEVDAALAGNPPGVFEDAFYVIAEGFLPSELGVTQANPTPAQLAGFAPAVSLQRPDSSPTQQMSAEPRQLLLQDASLPPNLRQRFTFVYRVVFTGTDDFFVNGNPEDQTIAVTATKETRTASGSVVLFHQPNPYMTDGSTSWLSTDVRVFQIEEGQPRFGFNIGADAAAASSFLQEVVDSFNTLGLTNHPYDTISTDQQASRLELSEKVNGKRVFNFAVARVRYRGQTLDANGVRVFFRLFTTAATGLDYNENSTYRRSAGATPVSLLGLQAGEIVTIPFYGDARKDTTVDPLTTQTDGLNVRDLHPAGGGDEDHAYFGAFLDFNQTTQRFPNHPVPENGPWNSNLKSIQELIRGLHQCLVAEVFFAGDPIDPGATPAGNDNLAQRNLVISESDNPGSLATHTVQHTFEIKATRPSPQVVVEPVQGGFETATVTRLVEAGPDELMIRWHDLPRETRMTVYMPDVDVREVVRRAGQTQEALRLEAVDDHTLLCAAGDVTFIPLPQGRTRNIPALLTLELPDGVRRGQAFRATLHQVSGRPRRILGAFELAVPVSDKSALLAPEIRKLSVLRHIHRAIPLEDPWHAVFTRYTGQIAERVRGFGGDPDRVVPAADGSGRDEAAERCARKGTLFSGLLAQMVVLAGLHPVLGLAGAALAAVAGFIWASSCHPSRCRWIVAALAGMAFGAAGLALLTFLGLTGPGAPVVLGLASVALGGLAALGVRFRCFRLGAP